LTTTALGTKLSALSYMHNPTWVGLGKSRENYTVPSPRGRAM